MPRLTDEDLADTIVKSIRWGQHRKFQNPKYYSYPKFRKLVWVCLLDYKWIPHEDRMERWGNVCEILQKRYRAKGARTRQATLKRKRKLEEKAKQGDLFK